MFGRNINKIDFEEVGGIWKRGQVGGGSKKYQVLAEFLVKEKADDLEIWHE